LDLRGRVISYFLLFHYTAETQELRDTHILCSFYLDHTIAGNAEEEENTAKADPSRSCGDIYTEKGAA
jgi:hypothetical protein